MKDNLQLIGQVLLIVLGPILAKHGITVGNDDVDKILAGLSEIIGIGWKFWHWNATPSAQPAASLAKTLSAIAIMFALAGTFGCARLQPGADPIVVNVERSETVAKSTFDLVLSVDNSKRDYFRTNAPAFHNFCEWLREPQTIRESGNPIDNIGTAVLPRASAMLYSLDVVKLDYKQARASSNELFTALGTVNGVVDQASTWLTVITNR